MLLHGSYMSIEKNESPDGRCLYRPKSSLKRYFHLTCLPKRMWSCWRTASLLPPVACLFVPQQLQLKSKPINDFLNSIHLAVSYWTPVPWKTSILLLTEKKEEKTSILRLLVFPVLLSHGQHFWCAFEFQVLEYQSVEYFLHKTAQFDKWWQ